MRILITGAAGQLGSELVAKLSGKYEVRGITRADADIRDYTGLRNIFTQANPEMVIHCAAYTDVDGAEANPDEAFATNSKGTQNVAVCCMQNKTKLIYVSTDYVFEGSKGSPYTEEDATIPRTVYGDSKLRGENRVSGSLLPDQWSTVRISWVYGGSGRNFVNTMIRLAFEEKVKPSAVKKKLHVVNDQFSSPSCVRDLAHQFEVLIENWTPGVVHAASQGEASRYELTKSIFEEVGVEIEIEPTSSDNFLQKAKRPRRSTLECKVLKQKNLYTMPPWRDGLSRFLATTMKVAG